MKVIIRTWNFSPEGKQCVLETVEVPDGIYVKVRQWAYDRKDLLLERKYAATEAVRYSLWDSLNQEFNSFLRTLPSGYQHEGFQFMAISYLYTLFSDNPELLPDEIEVRTKDYHLTSAIV